jgi:nickel transport protein
MKPLVLFFLLLCSLVSAHTVDHEVTQQQAVVVTVFLGDEQASYSEYEVFSPNSTEPVQLGRTDAQGRVSFLPDAPGMWLVKVAADSQHGLHGVTVEIDVDKDKIVKNTSAPPIAKHTRLVVGVSLLFGLFGLVSLFRSRKSNRSD